MPKWLKAVGKWIGKALINAAREEVERIVDEKKKRPRARPAGTPGK